MSVDLVPLFHRLKADAAKSAAPDRFLLLRHGDLEWADSDMRLDAKDAAKVIEEFEQHGNKIPIDHHHRTLLVEDGSAEKAPAAGWIGGLEFVKGEGLYAVDVEWTESAAKEIEKEEFRYISPVVLSDPDTGKIFELHSVALTNRPRTKDMIELLQAAERVAGTYGDDSMAKKKLDGAKHNDKKARKTKAEEHVDDELAPIATEEQRLFMKLQEMLELEPDTSREAILAAVVDALGGGEGEPEATDEVPAPADKSNKADDADKNRAALEVKAASFGALTKRVKTLEGQLETQAAEKRTSAAAVLVAEQIEEGKILPDNNDEVLKCAHKLAETDPETFKTLYASAPVICPPGVATASGGLRVHGVGSRASVISKASREFDADPQCAFGAEKKFYINAALRDTLDEREPGITETELKAIA